MIDNLEGILGIDLDGNGTSGSGHGLVDVAKAGGKGLVNYFEDATGLDIDGKCHTQNREKKERQQTPALCDPFPSLLCWLTFSTPTMSSSPNLPTIKPPRVRSPR